MDFTVPVFGIAVGLIFELVALGLGIAGLFQKGRKRSFAMLGTALSLLPLLAAFALWLQVTVDAHRPPPPWESKAERVAPLKDTMPKPALEPGG